jgi:hypothetical protein
MRGMKLQHFSAPDPDGKTPVFMPLTPTVVNVYFCIKVEITVGN